MTADRILIPRLLHMIWVGKPMPLHLIRNVKRWKTMHPDWILRVWGDEDFGWLEHQDYFDRAERYVPADAIGQFKADIARYEILWTYGGFYVDADTYPLRPINQALRNRKEFAAAEDRDYVGNTYLGAVPQHDVFGDVLASLSDSIEVHKGKRPCISTGPQFLTPIWRQHGCYTAPTADWFPYSYKDVRAGTVPEVKNGPYAVHSWEHARTLRAARGKV